VFLTRRLRLVDDARVGVALGYPQSVAIVSSVLLTNYTEMIDLRIASGQHAYCVLAYEFDCKSGPEHYKNFKCHFDRCFNACEEVGTDIRMDLKVHQEMTGWVLRAQARSA
jgi:hypothetical protein